MSSVSFNNITAALHPIWTKKESELKAKLNDIQSSAEVSQADIMEVQFKVQDWHTAQNIQAALIKDLGDSYKSIVQKI